MHGVVSSYQQSVTLRCTCKHKVQYSGFNRDSTAIRLIIETTIIVALSVLLRSASPIAVLTSDDVSYGITGKPVN